MSHTPIGDCTSDCRRTGCPEPTLAEINEYEDRLNKRLTDFGTTQERIEAERDFFFQVDKSHEAEKDHIAEGRKSQEELENGKVRYG